MKFGVIYINLCSLHLCVESFIFHDFLLNLFCNIGKDLSQTDVILKEVESSCNLLIKRAAKLENSLTSCQAQFATAEASLSECETVGLATDPICPSFITEVPFMLSKVIGEYCYYAPKDEMTYFDAVSYCTSYGGKILQILPQEAHQLFDQFSDSPQFSHPTWLGIYQKQQNEPLVYQDNNEIEFKPDNTVFKGTNAVAVWKEGQTYSWSYEETNGKNLFMCRI